MAYREPQQWTSEAGRVRAQFDADVDGDFCHGGNLAASDAQAAYTKCTKRAENRNLSPDAVRSEAPA